MCPPASAPLADIDYHCTNEELIMHLEKLQHGSPLPGNVVSGLNPYCRRPESLPNKNEIWYFIRSEAIKGGEDGLWEPKEEPSCVFLNTCISGWRTTLEYFKGQNPHSRKKTDWIMQEFKITSNELDQKIGDSKVQGPCMLCRVFRSGEDLTEQDTELKYSLCEKSICPIPFALLNTDSRFEKGSTSNHQEKDQSKKGTGESPPNGPGAENIPDNEFISRGDYLELWDLDAPGSPSSSSDNSSCVTMSSNECFDSLAFLQDLEPAQGPNTESRHTDFCLASDHRPDTVVTRIEIATSGSLISNEPRNLPDQGTTGADLASPSSAQGREKKRECSHENLSPSPHEDAPSTSRQSSDSEGSKKGNRRTKRVKNKYLCFLPFQFLF